HARVVVVGGGSLGVNLLYHLTKEGWTDVVLVEKGELTSGSTWHAAGLCPNFNGNVSLAKIHDYTIKLYDEIIPAETGLPSTFHKTGSLRLGHTEIEEDWFRQVVSMSRVLGVEANIISPAEARNINPLMEFDDCRIIVHTPNDGHVDPTSVVMPLAQLARKNGAEIYLRNRVIDINQLPSGEWEVITEKGTIIAEHVVNAAGSFAPEVGGMVGVNVPIVNLEHQYLVTEPHPEIEKLNFELPVVRDSWADSYLRQEGQGLLVGPYETHGCRPWALKGMDWGFDMELLTPDVERLMPWLDKCMKRMPIFQDVGIRTVVNGPITHTPDDVLLAGPQAGLTNFWNLCGASIGIAQGGVGKFLAQWIVHNETEINMVSLDSRRFGDWADKEYTTIRAIECYERMYALTAPNDVRPHGRPKRTSPLYQLLNLRGAQWGVRQGFEKPLWFATETVREDELSWRHSASFDVVGQECRAVQEAAGIHDLSGSAKFRVTGKEASAFLDNLSCNKLPGKDGTIGLSLFHAPEGGIMAELSITRINEQSYYLLGCIGSENRDFQWLQSHASDFDVEVSNVTNEVGALLLTGPRSREILQHLTEADLSNKGFPWLAAQNILMDGTETLAIRVSYAGELGWELHLPSYHLISIYEHLMAVGEPMGLRDFGGYAFNSMRLEKAYRAYGAEFTEEVSAVEAGMERFIDTSRDFIGVEALRQRQVQGTDQKLAYLIYQDSLPCESVGNEAVIYQGEVVGITTGGAYGHRIGKSIGFAYIRTALVRDGVELIIETPMGARTALVSSKPGYDPKNEKLRG
ncbi:MAG: GcvT family protein, partial [Amphritea sp.]|nr:GcvT family protein [Amphritea sp.]